MKKNKFITKTAIETQRIGKKLARNIIKSKPGAIILALIGELGAGKTTFTKGFAKGLGIKKIIQSPTFIIARRHPLKKSKLKNFYHFDAYRVGPKDLLLFGWEDLVNNPVNIIIVEWADRIEKILPKKHMKIFFQTLKNGKRKIIFK